MRRLFKAGLVTGVLVIGSAAPAMATPTGPVTHPGQHGVECGEGSATNSPGGGNSSNSPGSPFNEGSSGDHYAGSQPQNSRNGQASQYDVACYQATAH